MKRILVSLFSSFPSYSYVLIDEDLMVDVRSEKWLSQGSTKEMPTGKYRSAQKSSLKLDTLEDLLNYRYAWA